MELSQVEKDKIKEVVTDVSCGMLVNLIDLSLFIVSDLSNTLVEGFRAPVNKVLERSTQKAINDVLDFGVNRETVKRAFWKAVHKKLIKRGGENRGIFQITQAGFARLKELIPGYKEKRVWDNHLYLVTYDVPEESKTKREILRGGLRALGCGMLQDSVWVTLYNPKIVLKKLVLEHSIPGSVIVSDLGKDGSIGDEDLDDLVTRVFKLDELNEKYKVFIQDLKQKKFNKVQTYFQYLTILKDDPQLPFEILPYNWLGDKAFLYFKEKFPS